MRADAYNEHHDARLKYDEYLSFQSNKNETEKIFFVLRMDNIHNYNNISILKKNL